MLHCVSESQAKKSSGVIPIPTCRKARQASIQKDADSVMRGLCGLALRIEAIRTSKTKARRSPSGLQLVRRAGSGGAEEQLAAIRQGQIAAIGTSRSVLGLIT